MSLSCSCEYDPEPGDTCWRAPHDFPVLRGSRPIKCCSCGDKINPGDTTGDFQRYKVPDSDIECRIYGEDGEIPRASWFMCERCAGLFFSLDELGYCIDIHDDMRKLVAEYAEIHN